MKVTENRTLKENDPMGKALIRAVSVAIENIAFEEPELLPGPVKVEGEIISLSLQVVSPHLFQTRIIMDRDLAIRITRTIYRDDEKEITEDLLNDTLGEFLNTIIGTMMGDLTLGERIFEMGLPAKDNGKQEYPDEKARRYSFRIENSYFCIEISGDAYIE